MLRGEPSSRKKLQRFLGVSNFYRWFIRGYIKVVVPLTRLTSTLKRGHKRPRLHSLTSSPFSPVLLSLFTWTPIISSWWRLTLLMLLWVLFTPSKTRSSIPVLFFFCRLTPAEQNNDVGKQEHLAVVLALQEWRHWLEGSAQLFVIWTDHKNLAYFQSRTRRNPRQACWVLFMGFFRFTLTYRP